MIVMKSPSPEIVLLDIYQTQESVSRGEMSVDSGMDSARNTLRSREQTPGRSRSVFGELKKKITSGSNKERGNGR